MKRSQTFAQPFGDFVNLRGADDQRRRQGDDVAGHPDQQAGIKHRPEDVLAARARRPRARRQLDAGNQAEIADVDDMRQALQPVQRRLPMGFQRAGAGNRPSLA